MLESKQMIKLILEKDLEMDTKDLKYLQEVESSNIETLTLTKVHVSKYRYGSWVGFHNKRGLGFCFELSYCDDDDGSCADCDSIDVYKQTRAEAKLGLKGRKLDEYALLETAEYKALYPLIRKAKEVIREQYSKFRDLEDKKEEKKKERKRSKNVSYIRKAMENTE